MQIHPAILNNGVLFTGPAADGTNGQVLVTDGSGGLSFDDNGGGSGTVIPSHNDFRLTLESGVPVSSSDQTAKTNLYLTPYKGQYIALYTGAAWVNYTTTEMTKALGTLTSGLNYDVFLDYNGGSPAIELLAWTNDTTRATALTTQDGVHVKTGDTQQRYLGTIRTTSTTTTEDSKAKRFIWNHENQVYRPLYLPVSVEHNYTTHDWREVNGGSHRVEVVVGFVGSALDLNLQLMAANATSSTYLAAAIGEDSTTAPHADCVSVNGTFYLASAASISTAVLVLVPSIGYHYYAMLQLSNGTGTHTWRAATTISGDLVRNPGMNGGIMA